MSQENVELVRRAYERTNSNLELAADLFSADVEVDSTGAGPGNFGVIHGRARAEKALREYWETFDEFRVQLEDVIHADAERVVTGVLDTGRMEGSQAEIKSRLFHVWTFNGGKIDRLSIHTERAEALEAVGLRE